MMLDFFFLRSCLVYLVTFLLGFYLKFFIIILENFNWLLDFSFLNDYLAYLFIFLLRFYLRLFNWVNNFYFLYVVVINRR